VRERGDNTELDGVAYVEIYGWILGVEIALKDWRCSSRYVDERDDIRILSGEDFEENRS
jgi:hypothetical protein